MTYVPATSETERETGAQMGPVSVTAGGHRVAVPQPEELAAVKELVGEVEAGNIAAEKCIRAAGFSREGSASESGFTRCVLRLS
jgi:hypothetical protein